MNKILVGLILGLVVCVGIIFDFFDMFMSVALIVGMYELISNYFKETGRKEEILIGFGLLVLVITGEIISSKILKVKELIFILIIVIISDVFQEFSGKYFGKNKIGWISPNKTYEGYIGGYIGILIIYFINTYMKSGYNFVDLNLIYIFGILGDLFFSYIKRKIGVKDYSEILLSHGGVLDRLDAFFIVVLGFGLYKTTNNIIKVKL
jgi:phosphatidate cytidylyltransferase